MFKSKLVATSIVLVCGFMGSVAQAAPSTSEDLNPKSLVGVWKSTDAKNGALHGVIKLNADKSASMQVDAGGKDVITPLMTGTWQVKVNGSGKEKVLVLTMPPYGSSSMKYVLTAPKSLKLTYDNNNVQNFKKE